MDRTIHKKLTSKTALLFSATDPMPGSEGLLASLRQERKILEALSSELLQPRPQAVAAILEMARKM